MLGEDAIRVIIPLICGDGQRHQHAFAVQARLPRDSQDQRDEHGDNRRGAHERANASGEQHDEHDQARLITACLAQTVHDPGIHQRLADNEDRGDQNHDWVAETRQRFARR